MTPEYRAFLEELFASFGTVEVRRTFNFHGLFRDGTIFGLVADERVFLKTDVQSRQPFETAGSTPFCYRARDGSEVATSYYELPARFYNEPEEAAAWAQAAYEVALRSPTAARKQRQRDKGMRQPARRSRSS